LENGVRKLIKKYSRMPTWKPINNEIFFVNRVVLPSGKVMGDSLWTYSLRDSNTSFLTFIEGDNRYPKYSPDGTKIAFQSDGQVWIMQADGSSPKQLCEDAKMPTWLGNEKVIFIDFNPHRFTRDNGSIWIMNVDGSGKKQLTFNYGLELEE
jgi:Tol biopolymer transport system component